jgi:hypothetical protein
MIYIYLPCIRYQMLTLNSLLTLPQNNTKQNKQNKKGGGGRGTHAGAGGGRVLYDAKRVRSATVAM